MKLFGAAVLVVLLGLCFGNEKYSGYQVFRTSPLTSDVLAKLLQLYDHPDINFFGRPLEGRESLIMTSAEHVAELRGVEGLELHVHVADVRQFFENQLAENKKQKKLESGGANENVSFNRFMEFDEIQSYLDDVVSTFPEVASLEQVGTSHEGRPLRVLKLSRGGSKPGVFVDAGIHAAEWLGPPVALYAISQLTGASQELLDLADWYILPVANPDGYVFSWTEDRFWRKSRKPNEGSDCIGVDLNRNFDIHWAENNVTDPCAWNYPGPRVSSDPESRFMADLLKTKGQKGQISLYMSLHTYGQYLLYPYGYKYELPSEEMISAGAEAVEALKAVRGTVYTAGGIAQLLHSAHGSSVDFAYEVAGVPFTYVWELPAGEHVKLAPPPAAIRPVCEETWEGFKTLVRRAAAPK